MNWIIATEPYKQLSNGIVILHKLCDVINSKGHNCYLVYYTYNPDASKQAFWISDEPTLRNQKLNTPPLEQHNCNSTFVDNAIVIYPDAVIGNPLSAKKIVRYLGNKPGLVTPGHTLAIADNEFILSHSRILHNNPHSVIFNASIDHCFMYGEQDNPPRNRNLDILYHGKGSMYTNCPYFSNTLFVGRDWPRGRHQLSILLKRCRYLFTYDPWSNINIEAIAAGAIPIFMQYDPFRESEINSAELGPIPKGEFICIKDGKIYGDANISEFVSVQGADIAFDQAKDTTRSACTAPCKAEAAPSEPTGSHLG